MARQVTEEERQRALSQLQEEERGKFLVFCTKPKEGSKSYLYL